MDKNKVGLALLRGALGHIPVAGPMAGEFIRTWELNQSVAERVERAVEARLGSVVLPRIEELLSAYASGAGGAGGVLEGAATRAMGEVASTVLESLGDQVLELRTDSETADFTASLVGRVLDRPGIRDALTSPLLTGSGAVRVEPGELLAGRYRVLGVLGLGAYATVYQAHDEQLGHDVAVKIGSDPHPGWQRQIVREGLRLGQLDHPAIVRVHEVIAVPIGADAKTHAAIVMEYVEGASLRAYIAERGGRLPWSRARRVVDCILGALEHAHGHGVLHLDVKPENVMVVERDGTAKVLDFGLARATAGGENFTRILGGTPGYMAPELTQEREPGVAADVFSAGVVAYELLAGSLPDRTRLRPLRDQGVDVEPWIDAAILKALEPDPGHRHTSVAAFAAAVSARAPSARQDARAGEPNQAVLQKFPQLEAISKGRLLGLRGVILCSRSSKHVALSGDGSAIAVVDPDKIAFLRPDGSTVGSPLAVKETESVALSGDGRLCAAACSEPGAGAFGGSPSVIHAWSVATGEVLLERRLKGHAKVVFSPDGRLLASVGRWADEIAMWDIETGAPRWTRPVSGARDVSFAPDGAQVLFSTDQELVLLRTNDGEEVWRRTVAHEGVNTSLLSRGISLPGARVLTWETSRRGSVNTGKKKAQEVAIGALLLVAEPKGAIARRHETGVFDHADGRNLAVAGDVVYWCGGRWDGKHFQPELGALDVRTGLEVERLNLASSGFKLLGTSLAASPRRLVLLVEAPVGEHLALVYEVG